MIGEVTPTYFSLPQVRERIARDLPGCKIVCTLRDPVARAWSWYRVLHREGRIRADFEDEISNGFEPQLREANRYAFHLRAWRERFGAANVGVFLYDDLVADPQRFADSLLGFLGLPPVAITPAVAAHLMRNEASFDCRFPPWPIARGACGSGSSRCAPTAPSNGWSAWGSGDFASAEAARSRRWLRKPKRGSGASLRPKSRRWRNCWAATCRPGSWRLPERAERVAASL